MTHMQLHPLLLLLLYVHNNAHFAVGVTRVSNVSPAPHAYLAGPISSTCVSRRSRQHHMHISQVSSAPRAYLAGPISPTCVSRRSHQPHVRISQAPSAPRPYLAGPVSPTSVSRRSRQPHVRISQVARRATANGGVLDRHHRPGDCRQEHPALGSREGATGPERRPLGHCHVSKSVTRTPSSRPLSCE